MISNCSWSESQGKNGVKGDQTQKEYLLKPWNDGGWNYMLRYPDPKIQNLIAVNAIAAAQNDNIGYGQSDNRTFWDELAKVGYDASKITTPCNADCSSSSCAVCKAAGFLAGDTKLQDLVITSCSYMPSNFKSAGFQVFQDAKYLRTKDYLIPGDVLVNTSRHACIYVGATDASSLPAVPLSSTSMSGGIATSMFSSFYEQGDAVVREFCFLDDKLKRNVTGSKIKLSVINYAPLVENIAEAKGIYLTAGLAANMDTDTSQLSGNCKIVVDYLLGKGLNGAAACGVAGNMFHESTFRTDAVGDHGTSFGICQWHNSRGTEMKQFVGANWKNNLTGQLDFLWYELGKKYGSVLNFLRNTPNTVEGCKAAADYFVRNFEVPSDIENATIKRQATAADYFNQLVMTMYSPGNTAAVGELKSHKGTPLSIKKSIQVPANVQYGLLGNFTNYTYFYPKWGWYCRTIADIWNAQGRPSNKGIATVDGHYLIGLTPKFGTTGDLVVIHLENGEVFSAVMGDTKGTDATSEWGHVVYKGLVDVIEWEAIGSPTNAAGGTNIQLGSWNKVKVTSIDNYGSWLND